MKNQLQVELDMNAVDMDAQPSPVPDGVGELEELKISRPGMFTKLIISMKNLPWDSYFIGFISIFGGLIAWQLLSQYQITFVLSFENIPTPLKVWEQFLNLIVTQEFYLHIGAS